MNSFSRAIKIEENVGGVSAPLSTSMNTPGMGNAQPSSMAATTGVQQYSNSAKGSGDKWNALGKPYQQGNSPKKKRKVYKKKRKTNEQFYPSLEEDTIEESSISPYDKLGVAMAKKMGVPIYFKKGKKQTTHQKNFSK